MNPTSSSKSAASSTDHTASKIKMKGGDNLSSASSSDSSSDRYVERWDFTNGGMRFFVHKHISDVSFRMFNLISVIVIQIHQIM